MILILYTIIVIHTHILRINTIHILILINVLIHILITILILILILIHNIILINTIHISYECHITNTILYYTILYYTILYYTSYIIIIHILIEPSLLLFLSLSLLSLQLYECRAAHGRFPKSHRVSLGRDPGTFKIRHRVKITSTINLFGFETLKLKIRRLKLWKPTWPVRPAAGRR